MEQIIKEFKKSELNVRSKYSISYITQSSEYLVPLTITASEESFKYEFELNKEKSIKDLRHLRLNNRYQFLINLEKIESLNSTMKFSMDPENILFTVNFLPRILIRDVYADTETESDFVKGYKSLIGFLLNPKYSFEDYFNGGESLLKKNDKTMPFFELTTVESIVTKLEEELLNHEEYLNDNYILVKNKKYRSLKIFRIIGLLAIVVAVISSVYAFVFKIPTDNKLITASENYVKQEYVVTLDKLNEVDIKHMSPTMKYIYAVSFVKSDSLSDVQRNNILANISTSSHEMILDFWVYLGKKDYVNALDTAKLLGDKEYQLYSYLKERNSVETDSSLGGEERESRVKEIDASIKEIEDSIKKDTD